MPNSCIVMPMYNDWQSAAALIEKIDAVVSDWDQPVSIVVVNDGSSEPDTIIASLSRNLAAIKNVTVIHLACNLGHQRAIAVGLVYARKQNCFDTVFVMDSDGEDRPEDLHRLWQEVQQDVNIIVTADRGSRSEGWLFRTCYRCYKMLFAVLCGKSIRFGNYCALPARVLDRIVYMPDLWNSLAGSILTSKCPLKGIPTHRGNRITGSSKMNFISLLLFGMGAISVFSEIMLARCLVFLSLAVSASIVFLLVIGMSAGGHAGSMLFWLVLTAVLVMMLFVTLIALVQGLKQRSIRLPGPVDFAEAYIASKEVF